MHVEELEPKSNCGLSCLIISRHYSRSYIRIESNLEYEQLMYNRKKIGIMAIFWEYFNVDSYSVHKRLKIGTLARRSYIIPITPYNLCHHSLKATLFIM